VSPPGAKPADRKTERRLNTPLLPISVAVFGVLYALTGYRGWLAFVIGLGGVWLLAAWWVYSLERALTVTRRVHLGWASVGDSVPEQLEVTNKGRFPAIWLEIVDESDTLLEPLRLVTDVESYATRRRSPVHRFKRRGLYTLGPTLLRTGDPFGIHTLTVRDSHTTTIMVTPPQLSLAQLRISAGGWAGDLKRRRGALAREISDAGIRDYIPGDSLKRIHWQASAHHDSLVVRQLEAATAEDWWIFVDLEAAVQSGTGRDSTLELSIVLAASLAMRGLKEHRRVGMALVGPRLTWLEPRADLAHRWKILRALAMAEAGNRSLAELLPMGRPSQTASLIVITPATNPAWVSAVDPRHRSGSTTVLLVDPTDFGSGLDQSNVASALARSRIPYRRMPGSLLREAYSSSGGVNSERTPGVDPGRRYLQRTGAAWQSMD
jgi:uncharacterized protein (DUF58 family)